MKRVFACYDAGGAKAYRVHQGHGAQCLETEYSSKVMGDIMDLVHQVARTDSTVLIQGEKGLGTGTGAFIPSGSDANCSMVPEIARN